MSRADNAQKDGLYGLVDANINYVIQPMYYYLGDVAANGLLRCKLSSSGKYGYVNTKGEKVIDYQFDEAYTFCQERKWSLPCIQTYMVTSTTQAEGSQQGMATTNGAS